MALEKTGRPPIRYYASDLLALYHSQPDRYEVVTDDFSGQIRTGSQHYEREASNSGKNLLAVKFGFRLRLSGEWALAAWGPDVDKASPDEAQKWAGFQLGENELALPVDARFQEWFERALSRGAGMSRTDRLQRLTRLFDRSTR